MALAILLLEIDILRGEKPQGSHLFSSIQLAKEFTGNRLEEMEPY